MELNTLDFEARKRNAWQVFDLALLAVHRWGFRMFVLWFLQATIVFVPLMLFFDSVVAAFVIWWLKPVFERPLLHFASQAAFGYRAGIGECLRIIPKLGFKKIFLILTVRRLSLQRAFIAPVDQLEGLKGKQRTGRIAVLESLSNHRQAAWLIFCLHAEFIFMSAFSFALFAMVPGTENIEFDVELLFLLEDSVGVVASLTTLLGYGVIAPYYVTGGFLGYLNSRVELEAWDIELAFKRMAKRLTPVLSIILCMPIILVLAGNPVEAAPLTSEEIEGVGAQIEELYSDEDVVVINKSWEPDLDNFAGPDIDLEWLFDLIKLLAETFSGDYSWFAMLFWGVIIALLGFVLWKLVRLPRIQLTPLKKQFTPEIPQFVISVEQRDIPDDLIAAATSANREGNSRLALTWLLYYGLGYAQKHYDVYLHSSMTERECEAALEEKLPSESLVHYSDLIKLWITEAWAHHTVSSESIDAMIKCFSEIETTDRSALYS